MHNILYPKPVNLTGDVYNDLSTAFTDEIAIALTQDYLFIMNKCAMSVETPLHKKTSMFLFTTMTR